MSSLSMLAFARAAPRATALAIGAATYSTERVGSRVTERAAELRALGLTQPGAPLVAIDAVPDFETLCSVYALIETGVAFVPLHARWTAAERDAALARVAAQRLPSPELRAAASRVSPGLAENAPVAPARPLVVLFTSGSGAAPKAAQLSRGAFSAATEGLMAHVGARPDDRWLLSLPYSHVGGFAILVRSLWSRRPLVVADADPTAAAKTERLAEAVERHGVTCLSLVPAQLHALLELGSTWRLPGHVRAIFVGGSRIAPRLLDEAAARGWPLFTSYGMTETCAQLATGTLQASGTSRRGAGNVLSHARVRIVDGRVHVSGASLFDGYLGTDRNGSSRLDTSSLERGWFDTGDLGYLDDDQRLHVTGRADDLIVTGGENVNPREIELELLALSGVSDAHVFGASDEVWGELVVAALLTRESRAVLSARVARLGERLAAYKLPRRLALFESFPSLPQGKIDRTALEREAAQRWWTMHYTASIPTGRTRTR